MITFRAAISSFLFLALACFSAAQESEITVVNSDDEGEGSLRAALNTVAPGGTIIFNTALSGETITLDNGTLVISGTVTIDASSLTQGITLDANSGETASARVFIIEGGAVATFSNLTLRNGSTPNGDDGELIFSNASGDDARDGGAIHNSGTLTLNLCTLADNRTGNGGNGGAGRGGNGGHGGAIYNQGNLTLIDCSLTGNRAGDGGLGGNGDLFAFGGRAGSGGNGGAIVNDSGAVLTMTGCTLSENQSGNGGTGGNGINFGGNGGRGGHAGSGGSIHNNGTFTLTNCTLADNGTGSGGTGGDSETNDAGDGGAGGPGGAIYNNASGGSLTHCTIVQNQTGLGGIGGTEGDDEIPSGNTGPAGTGGGISTSSIITLTNCIVSTNIITSLNDVEGLISTGDGAYNILNSDFPILLRPLGDYGGLTFTMPPFSASPAVDASDFIVTTALDQRGLSRAIGRSDNIPTIADLGAVELQEAAIEYDLFFSLDTDGDGLSNGDEFIIGTAPFLADNLGIQNLEISSFNQTTRIPTLAFAYRDPDFRLQITRSTDLITFDSLVADSNTTAGFSPTNNATLVEITDSSPPAGGRAFYRLKPVRPE